MVFSPPLSINRNSCYMIFDNILLLLNLNLNQNRFSKTHVVEFTLTVSFRKKGDFQIGGYNIKITILFAYVCM